MSGFAARLRDPKLWLGLATAALIVFLVVDEAERSSPGPLTSVHAAQPELSGNAGCARCHAAREPSARPFEATCTKCHAEIGAQLAAASGFHGKLADARDCAHCHVEHLGDVAPLVDARAFARAGVADVTKLEHDFVAFDLRGAHAELACSKCHALADVAQLAKGQRRFLGLSQRCASCHEDPHEGKFASDCASCHGQDSFTSLANFRHTPQFPLEGRHAGIACEQCHAKGGPHAIEVVGAADHVSPPRACQDCHASPHAASFVAALAADLRAEPRATCGTCHSARDGSFRAHGAHMAPEFHSASGFELLGAHARADCAACHANELGSFRARHPGGRAQDCGSCHAHPHATQFGARPSCLQCHDLERWSPSTVEASTHSTFALTGAHAQAACNACHLALDSGVQLFRGAPRACESCHADAHEERFARELALVASEVLSAGGSCGLCHSTTRFDDATARGFDHAHWTDFALVDAHSKPTCEACHPRAATPDEFGRTFGRVVSANGLAPTNCANCHRDAHRGAFADLLVVDARRGLCAQCHGVDSFQRARESFDHGLTGFELDGAHALASCEQCHGGPAAEAQRRLGFVAERHPALADPAAVSQCNTCHADVHGFARTRSDRPEHARLALDCSTCHTTQDFAQTARSSFDHGEWTRFPLAGAHGATVCEACHVPTLERDASGRRFGRAAGTDCSACHVDVHAGQFAREGQTDCARCHDPQRPLREIRFDHQRDTRFALDANHRKLDCAACHQPWPTPDGRSVVRYKPLGVECADCHGTSGGKRE